LDCGSLLPLFAHLSNTFHLDFYGAGNAFTA
jgi:hypothetical protein